VQWEQQVRERVSFFLEKLVINLTFNCSYSTVTTVPFPDPFHPQTKPIEYINVHLYSLKEKIEMIFVNLNLGDLFISIIILQHIK
jgi:hypothetical protein